jgi:hypothetical protein
VTLPTTSGSTIPTDFQYRVWCEYRTIFGGTVKKDRWTSGWFSFTADANLKDVVEEQYAPPTYATQLTAALDAHAAELQAPMDAAVGEAEAARDAAVDISNIDVSDDVVEALVKNTGGAGPKTSGALITAIASQAAPLGLALAIDGQATALTVPSPTSRAVILTDTVSLATDGVKYFSPIKVAGRIVGAYDDYYAYASGHDGTSIRLLSAPAPEGPWTWRDTVVTAASSALLKGHVSSPHAIWWNGQLILYVHGDQESLTVGQGTVAFTSADGVTFTEAGSVAFPAGATGGATAKWSYDAISKTYVRPVDIGGRLAAVWQGNIDSTNGQAGGSTVKVGLSTSSDGLTWVHSKTPLLANIPPNRGPFGPYLFRVGGFWLLAATFATTNDVQLYASERLEPGTFRALGKWFDPPAGQGWSEYPTVFWDNGVCHLFHGTLDPATSKGRIWHGLLDWSAAA